LFWPPTKIERVRRACRLVAGAAPHLRLLRPTLLPRPLPEPRALDHRGYLPPDTASASRRTTIGSSPLSRRVSTHQPREAAAACRPVPAPWRRRRAHRDLPPAAPAAVVPVRQRENHLIVSASASASGASIVYAPHGSSGDPQAPPAEPVSIAHELLAGRREGAPRPRRHPLPATPPSPHPAPPAARSLRAAAFTGLAPTRGPASPLPRRFSAKTNKHIQKAGPRRAILIPPE
jgi:hypothetical protein